LSIRSAVLFQPTGSATPLFLSQWRRQRPATPLRPSEPLHESGSPTRYFRSAWTSAFPSRPPLPAKVANRDGTGTDEFWTLLEGMTA